MFYNQIWISVATIVLWIFVILAEVFFDLSTKLKYFIKSIWSKPVEDVQVESTEKIDLAMEADITVTHCELSDEYSIESAKLLEKFLQCGFRVYQLGNSFKKSLIGSYALRTLPELPVNTVHILIRQSDYDFTCIVSVYNLSGSRLLGIRPIDRSGPTAIECRIVSGVIGILQELKKKTN
jgi:hypothetical protein